MSIWQLYRGLSSKAKLGVGAGFVVWGLVGLRMSDKAEEKLGLTPTDEDRAALERATPRIRLMEKGDRS